MEALQSPEVQSVINLGKWSDLAAVLDRLELQESLLADPLVLWPSAMHILAHTYNMQLADARFLFKRLPADVKRVDVQVQAAFKIVQHLWHQDYQGVWPVLTGTAWEGPMQALAQALHQKLQQQAMRLIQSAYADITVDKAGVITGMQKEATLTEATKLGWTVQGQQLHVTKAASTAAEVDLTERNYRQLKQLTDLVIHFQANGTQAAA